eukprot:5960603-Pleurochrysis_carterae.AAC.1
MNCRVELNRSKGAWSGIDWTFTHTRKLSAETVASTCSVTLCTLQTAFLLRPTYRVTYDARLQTASLF